ncbi:MAG: 30S ribosomal protein S20 [Anaerolineales bacterium]
MANIKSAIKRNRQNDRLREHNRLFRSSASGYVKKANLAIESGDAEKAQAATKLAISALDKAAAKGIIHKNNAANRKSAIMRKLAALGGSNGATPAAAKPKTKSKAKASATKAKSKVKAKARTKKKK